MAKKGSNKDRSVKQEESVALLYEGKRSASSGAADNDQGDVRTFLCLIECKTKGSAAQDRKRLDSGKPLSRSGLLKTIEKVTFEAWSEGREPVVVLREWAPESRLADADGWVDLTVRLQHEDVHRDRVYRETLDVYRGEL